MAIAPPTALSDIDLTDLETFVDRTPHDWFKRLRDEAPCYWQPEAGGRGFWSVTRYEDILALQKQPLLFSAGVGGTSLDDLTPEQVERRDPAWISALVTWLASPQGAKVSGKVFEAWGWGYAVAESWQHGPITPASKDPAELGPKIEEIIRFSRKNAGIDRDTWLDI